MNWMNVRLLVVAACAPSNCDNKVLPPVYPRPIMSLPNVLIIGSGEYVSGIVSSEGAASSSDKSKGVVALVMFDLRARKKVGSRIAIAGTCGLKFPHIRRHFESSIAGAYRDIDVSFDSFPADDVAKKPDSYKDAIATFAPGDLAIIFTPDDSHFDIAKACIEHGMHLCVTKPLVQTLQQHRDLAALALDRGVLSYVEVHKRWDPIYLDARARLRAFGDFSFFQAFMSQPKKQLKTFAGWAGLSSDISFYLNSHHVDYHCWCMQGIAKPVTVSASASTGVASAALSRDCADSITLMVQWRNEASGNLGVATYTASWAASPSDVHRYAIA
jgi:D-galacturonate reductase